MNETKLDTKIEHLIQNQLQQVLVKYFGAQVEEVTFAYERLSGGTVGDVYKVYGDACLSQGIKAPYKLVFKVQKKWERHGDPNSWRREYDLYASRLGEVFVDGFGWPRCYHAEVDAQETRIWMAYSEGITGMDLTEDMYEMAAESLGRFQGRLFAQKPVELESLANLSDASYAKNFYWHYRSWPEVYDYIRSEACKIPKHLCDMLIRLDEDSDAIWERIEQLPVVLCHRDYWITNVFYEENHITAIDWDTTGWGYFGEDLASLLADEAKPSLMVQCYRRCVLAYYRGFNAFSDAAKVSDQCVYELILALFGYRLVEWYKFSETSEEKNYHLNVLQKIYDIGHLNKLS